MALALPPIECLMLVAATGPQLQWSQQTTGSVVIELNWEANAISIHENVELCLESCSKVIIT